MSISESDIVFRKSGIVTNTNTNGGRKGSAEVLAGVRHSLFPRVTKAERTSGVTRYRKLFFCNENADDESAYGVLVYMELPSNGGDHFYLRSGRNDALDIQGNLELYNPLRIGTGTLKTNITAGDSLAVITMEDSDYIFPNGDFIHVANKVKSGQTIAADVAVGDSVELIGGTWEKIAYTSSIADPYGRCVGTSLVMTIDGSTKEEWLHIKQNLTEDEVIGVGDGTDHPVLSTLTNITNGICRKLGVDPSEPDHAVVVTATIAGSPSTIKARFLHDGTLDTANSDASAGVLNMATGEFTTDITWDVAPESGGSPGNITCTYAENSFAKAGNDYTVTLEDGETFANSYTAGTTTYVGACLYEEEIVTSSEDWVETSAGGTYDETTYPPTLYNDGTVEDTWTITVGAANSFACTGAATGALASGVVGTTYAPVNPDTGQPYFSINGLGWGGSWTAGNTIVFVTHPSAMGMWMEEEVPALTETAPNNLFIIGAYAE